MTIIVFFATPIQRKLLSSFLLLPFQHCPVGTPSIFFGYKSAASRYTIPF